MCSVSMSPTFSSPTFFASLKNFDGIGERRLDLGVSTLGAVVVPPGDAAGGAGERLGVEHVPVVVVLDPAAWSPSLSSFAFSASAPRSRAMSTSDALAALSETPVTFSEIGCDSSAPAAPAAVGAPSILTFSARSSFEGPVGLLQVRRAGRSRRRRRSPPRCRSLAGAVGRIFLSLPPPQPAATRAMAQADEDDRTTHRRASPSGWMHSLIHSAWGKEDRQQAQNQESGTDLVPWIEGAGFHG